MPFEIRHAPKTDFNIADEYFNALTEQMRQRDRNALAQASIDQRAGAAAATDARAAERLAFQREQANLRQLAEDQKRRTEEEDANLIVNAYGGAIEDPQPEDVDPDVAAANQLQEDLFGAADRPLVEQETQGELDTPYGVKIPIVKPRSMAGARLLLDALNHNLDRKAKEEEAKRKEAEKATQAGQDRERAARLQQLTGIGLPRPGGRRTATPEEGGILMEDPYIQEPDDPGIQFDRPEDVLAVARLTAEREKNRPASEAEIDAAAETLLRSGRYKSATEARAAAEARMKYKLPIELGSPRSSAGRLDFKLILAKEAYDRAEAVYAKLQRESFTEDDPELQAGQQALEAALRKYAAEYSRVHGDDGNVPDELLPAKASDEERAALIKELEEGL